tara:strand:- start:6073 stop:7056 length:984 start_codon:yes stop_codon:yes gene_type:complete
MRPANVLLTGFEPFDNSNYNISEEVTKLITDFDFKEFFLTSKILTVDNNGALFVSKLIKKERFDCIIHLGYSSKATKINLESRAKNLISMRIKDNSGRKILNSKVILNSKPEYFSTINLPQLLDARSLECVISNDAGEFICNEAYYYTLNTIYTNKILDRFGRLLPCIFIHLPSQKFIPIENQIKTILELVKAVVNRKILTVVAALIRNENNKVLIAKRNQFQPHPGKWEFPGGKLNVNESYEEGLKREIFEELNLEIDITTVCGDITHLYEDYFIKLKLMNAKINNYSNIKLNVHDEIEWVHEHQLSEYDWLEANLKLIDIIQNQS